ncbi:hypothetical protein KB20921_04640 [Edwardsiella ictaluri]|nr:hypothetical protein KH20906_04630 [Edwardsiella ictaluri]BEI01203.1 hypothetical protein KB20921_04640 [Edwardsiella ictaluri]BEI04676.1 hypothetical protein KH201010_04620 [Edwardsiella ictaluri]BEI08132.1 hypothetical protein STU22726_04630 [Edwardsiella ictaluri]BEI11613.1 hypothetical protein STU22816_04660 [Edwardsiella ictaluri]
MGKSPDAQEGDGDIRAAEQTDHAGANHQHGTYGDHQLTGGGQVEFEVLLKQWSQGSRR